MIVMKFGGTSVGDASRMLRAAELVAGRLERSPLVVVSALSGVTDRLVDAASAAEAGHEAAVAEHAAWLRARHEDVLRQLDLPAPFAQRASDALDAALAHLGDLVHGVRLLAECTPRTRDAIVSLGELTSHRLLAAVLNARGVEAVAVDPRSIVVTDDRFGEAEVDPGPTASACARHVLPFLERRVVPVTGGFVGATPDGITTTLGRGGSDLSATHLGVALGADEVEIWTDVDGMMTANPRLVPAARTLPRVTFQEAAELAYFGAKVLHPATIRPAVERRIPVRILNTFHPDRPGTVVGDGPEGATDGPACARAVAWKDGITTVSVTSPRMLGASGFLARVFAIFERHRTSVDVVTTSEVSVSMTVDRADRLDAITADLSELCQVRVETGMSLVCVVGHRFLESPRLVGEILATVEPATLRMFCLGSSDTNLSLVVSAGDAMDIVRRLHARFLEGPT